jgi:hypothetical protein
VQDDAKQPGLVDSYNQGKKTNCSFGYTFCFCHQLVNSVFPNPRKNDNTQLVRRLLLGSDQSPFVNGNASRATEHAAGTWSKHRTARKRAHCTVQRALPDQNTSCSTVLGTAACAFAAPMLLWFQVEYESKHALKQLQNQVMLLFTNSLGMLYYLTVNTRAFFSSLSAQSVDEIWQQVSICITSASCA